MKTTSRVSLLWLTILALATAASAATTTTKLPYSYEAAYTNANGKTSSLYCPKDHTFYKSSTFAGCCPRDDESCDLPTTCIGGVKTLSQGDTVEWQVHQPTNLTMITHLTHNPR